MGRLGENLLRMDPEVGLSPPVVFNGPDPTGADVSIPNQPWQILDGKCGDV